MIVHKNKIVQEQVAPLSSLNGDSKASHWDRVVPSDPEVSAKASRRRFTAKYKLCILKAADPNSPPASPKYTKSDPIPSACTFGERATIGSMYAGKIWGDGPKRIS